MLYVLEFTPQYKRAKYYVGWCKEHRVKARINEHLSGRGSPLVKAVVEAGYDVSVALLWPHATREVEKWWKRHKNTPRLMHKYRLGQLRRPDEGYLWRQYRCTDEI